MSTSPPPEALVLPNISTPRAAGPPVGACSSSLASPRPGPPRPTTRRTRPSEAKDENEHRQHREKKEQQELRNAQTKGRNQKRAKARETKLAA